MNQWSFSERLRRLGVRCERRATKDESRELQNRLEELELRFNEHTHRVKNNQQMVLGIVAAASHATINAETRSVLSAVTRKLEALLNVQNLLQRAGHARHLRCDEFVRELSQNIRDSSPRQFVLMLECEPMELPSNVGVPLGPILNELLTNAIKHGIGPDNGRVHVGLKSLGNTIELRVDDNGSGIEPQDLANGGSGLSMVQHLTAQLHGEFHTRPGPGGQCVLRFQKPAVEQH